MQEMQPGKGIRGAVGAADLLKGLGSDDPPSLLSGSTALVSEVSDNAVNSPLTGRGSDLHLKVLKRSILAWLPPQKIMRSRISVTVRVKTFDGETNWKCLSHSLLIFFFFF